MNGQEIQVGQGFDNTQKSKSGFLANVLRFLPIVGGFVQSGIDAKTARYNTDRTIQANKELAEYAYSKDLEMWNAQNAYNSPGEQMKRLESAGLNPNLVYGSGTVAGNVTGQFPKYNAPTVEYKYKPSVNLPQTISMYQDMALRQAQIDNVKADTESKQAGTIIKVVDKYLKENKLYWESGFEGSMSAKNVQLLNEAQLSKYQADVYRKIMDALIDKAYLSNIETETDIEKKQVETVAKGLEAQITQKDINWYFAKSLGDMVMKGIAGLGLKSLIGKGGTALSSLRKPRELSRAVVKYYR